MPGRRAYNNSSSYPAGHPVASGVRSIRDIYIYIYTRMGRHSAQTLGHWARSATQSSQPFSSRSQLRVCKAIQMSGHCPRNSDGWQWSSSRRHSTGHSLTLPRHGSIAPAEATQPKAKRCAQTPRGSLRSTSSLLETRRGGSAEAAPRRLPTRSFWRPSSKK